ncbi:MAG: hypothetical protein IPI90_15805 [Saprospiraceae bacterium]|nr:hypothetical protein [Candidatus Vicinibacter affinis]
MASLKASWQAEKEIVDEIQVIKKKIDEINIAAEKAERESDFGLVAKLKYGDLKEQDLLLKAAEEKLKICWKAAVLHLIPSPQMTLPE